MTDSITNILPQQSGAFVFLIQHEIALAHLNKRQQCEVPFPVGARTPGSKRK